MAATRVALATQRALPDWEVDDLPFQEALGARGIGYDCVAWDDPDIAWSAYDAILLRTTWDYMEKADAFREWIGYAATQTRLFNPVEILRWNLQKTYLRALAAEGVPLAPTLWVAGGEAVAPVDVALVRGVQDGHAAAVRVVDAGKRALRTLGLGDIERDVVAVDALDHLGAPLHVFDRWQIAEPIIEDCLVLLLRCDDEVEDLIQR